MRRKSDRVMGGVYCEAEHAAKNRVDDHGGGPDLVGGAGGEGGVVVAGEDLGGVAERAVEGEEGVGAEIGVRRGGAVIAVFADAGPAGEERPDGAEMVAAGAGLCGVAGDD